MRKAWHSAPSGHQQLCHPHARRGWQMKKETNVANDFRQPIFWIWAQDSLSVEWDKGIKWAPPPCRIQHCVSSCPVDTHIGFLYLTWHCHLSVSINIVPLYCNIISICWEYFPVRMSLLLFIVGYLDYFQKQTSLKTHPWMSSLFFPKNKF